MRRSLACLALAAFLAAGLATAQDRKGAGGKPAPDVAAAKYGPHERHALDFWRATAEKPAPLVVFIHGGGFVAGSKEGLSADLLRRFQEAGFAVAAINYRYSKQEPYPGPMRDGARAVQFLRARAAAWGIDPMRVAAIGGSAGAGISLWLAFHDDLADAQNADPVLRESSRLACAVGLGAQTSYDPRWIARVVGGRAHEHPALPLLYGLKPEELDSERAYKLYADASPITHLTADDPPVYLVYNGQDEPRAGGPPGAAIHSAKFGHALAEAAKPLGVSCTVKVEAGGDAAGILDFLKAQLGK
ncbi:MAG: alpha/beta hydrolase [Planctomycetes bacterium]|nr:alpha/beta hydrolase [Planctomycetota bacterium]